MKLSVETEKFSNPKSSSNVKKSAYFNQLLGFVLLYPAYGSGRLRLAPPYNVMKS
jgi:hypothetical protein